VLGRVLAHEVGHLLLPVGHSKTGIMRATVDLTITPQRFTPEQIRLIRRAVLGDRTARR
jgi:hypothetical protein